MYRVLLFPSELRAESKEPGMISPPVVAAVPKSCGESHAVLLSRPRQLLPVQDRHDETHSVLTRVFALPLE